jgi:hypothetical protein
MEKPTPVADLARSRVGAAHAHDDLSARIHAFSDGWLAGPSTHVLATRLAKLVRTAEGVDRGWGWSSDADMNPQRVPIQRQLGDVARSTAWREILLRHRRLCPKLGGV